MRTPCRVRYRPHERRRAPMVQKLIFYLDDSGTRFPDHAGSKSAQGFDWFALGGILVKDEDEDECRKLHAELTSKWKMDYPLHSVRIRGRQGKFAWLGTSGTDLQQFMTDLTHVLVAAPLLGLACVIDRPGYNARYKEKYGDARWQLCKTAFTVAVERAAKYAMTLGRKLDVRVEKTNQKADRDLAQYFAEMKKSGCPFDPTNAAKYDPLSQRELSSVLYDFKTKDKSSPMIQFADLYLYPMCRGGYEPQYRPYRSLRDARKLRDDHLLEQEVEVLGIKYSCFELARSASGTTK